MVENNTTQKQSNFWLTVTALSGVPFIMVLGNSMLIPVLPDIRNALNLTQIQVSMLISLFSLPAGIIIPIAGFLSDRLGRKVVIIPSLIIYGAGSIIAALAATFFQQYAYALILAGRVMQGIGAFLVFVFANISGEGTNKSPWSLFFKPAEAKKPDQNKP